MKPYGFIPFFFTKKNGRNDMKEYKRILLLLKKEKILVILAICSGIIATILNLSRTIFMVLIVDNLIQRELKGAYVYIYFFAGSYFL
ncbi:ABC transporter ATP-binding protein, partial [Bacillus thuringiensis]